jgi:pimeloyl-ACP methyl ester carboxylesterase
MNIPVTLAWLTAMLDWGDNQPADLRCPTLWLSGSENENAIVSMKAYENKLEGTGVKVQVIEGIDHIGEFEEIDLVFPIMMNFTKG